MNGAEWIWGLKSVSDTPGADTLDEEPELRAIRLCLFRTLGRRGRGVHSIDPNEFALDIKNGNSRVGIKMMRVRGGG